jgi:hypothetical protein
MQEIAKHDGTIQVRAISPEAATFLELFRIDRLLQRFASLPARPLGFAIAAVATTEGTSSAAVQSQLVAA